MKKVYQGHNRVTWKRTKTYEPVRLSVKITGFNSQYGYRYRFELDNIEFVVWIMELSRIYYHNLKRPFDILMFIAENGLTRVSTRLVNGWDTSIYLPLAYDTPSYVIVDYLQEHIPEQTWLNSFVQKVYENQHKYEEAYAEFLKSDDGIFTRSL